MKKALSIFLAVVVVLSSFAVASFAAETYSGKCGENLTWSLDTATGELVISGTGPMYNWSSGNVSPWYYKSRESIKSVVIDAGVTTIGSYAFRNCNSLISVEIPEVVTTIGQDAFGNCNSLISVEIPESVTEIGMYVFYGCDNLTGITIPGSVKTIANNAFSHCYKLTSVTILDGVTTIGDFAFGESKNLTSITFPTSIKKIGTQAFQSCSKITDIYYEGSSEQWDAIAFGISNDSLFNATMHFNHKHSYSVIEMTQAACIIGGTVTYGCDCGNRYTETIPASGHNFLDGECICGETPEKLSNIQSITYVQQESTRKTFTVTCNGRASMIQFVEPDGGTRTYDRYNKNVTITGYNADGEVVNSMSRDLAYEVWEIYTNLSVGTTVKLRAKFNSKWEEDKRTLLVDEYNPVVSMELASYSGKKGAVMATVVADEKTEKVMFKMSDGSSVTVAPSGKDENGNNIFTGKAWMNEDGLNVINVLIRRKNMWKQVGVLEYTVK